VTQTSSFYAALRAKRGDDQSLANCVEAVVAKLEKEQTSGNRPGMLLGKIQSGKTRAFVGAIAHAFDRGFALAVVLTKGTKTLSAQTVARLSTDFEAAIDADRMNVYDIMKLPERLTGAELKRKIVVVAKKQHQNLDRLNAFIRANPPLKGGKVLIVDDEADLASVRWKDSKDKNSIEQGEIAKRMDVLRAMVGSVAFLQVTATPYSLYLQPEDYTAPNGALGYEFLPMRPAFTELLPIHGAYVGGNDYFGTFSEQDPRSRLFVMVPTIEQDALRKPDQRRIKKAGILENRNVAGLRRALVTFIVSVAVRRWQEEASAPGGVPPKYAMVIHNDTQRSAQSWQQTVVEWILETLGETAAKAPIGLDAIFGEAYDDLKVSVAGQGGKMPARKVAFATFVRFLVDDEIVTQKVNSDAQVMDLLDKNAELKLRTPLNIFIGGNILDRGITIPNLIAFYYGRNPRTMQADTVLQHSRMYGARDRKDLAVTRFHTSSDVYDRLYIINEFENALREGFETGAHDAGVVFLQTDAKNRVKPCAPNKIKLSNITSIKKSGMLLPTRFTTVGGVKMTAIQKKLDGLISDKWHDAGKFFPIPSQIARDILDLIGTSMEFEGEPFDWQAMKSLMAYYATIDGKETDDLLVFVITGRNLDRGLSGDRSGLSILGSEDLRRQVQDPKRKKPLLILLQQQGAKDKGWSGQKFWWPILAAPAAAKPCVFAAKTVA
jgi:hypothetical protein